MKSIRMKLLIVLILSMLPLGSVSAAVTGNRVTGQDQVELDVPMTMSTQAIPLDVKVPLLFPIDVNQAGEIIAAPKYFEIENYTLSPVKIVSFKYTEPEQSDPADTNNWKLVSELAQGLAAMNSKTFALGVNFTHSDTNKNLPGHIPGETNTIENKDMITSLENKDFINHVIGAAVGATPTKDKSISFDYRRRLTPHTADKLADDNHDAGSFFVTFDFAVD